MHLNDTKQFTNPFPIEGDYDKALHGRVSADMPIEVKNAVTSLRPTTGTPQIVVNILWLKLVNALHEHSINNFTQQNEFTDFVANLRFVDGRKPVDLSTPAGSTASRLVQQTITSNDRRGETSGADAHPEPSSEPRNTSSADVSGSGASGKRRGKGQAKA